MASLIVEKGNSKDLGRIFPLGENPVIIGRHTPGDNIDFALLDDHKYVSRRHAEISFREKCFHLRDLNSVNGTTIDGVRISSDKSYPLKGDSLIGLGITSAGASVTLRFQEVPTDKTRRIDSDTIENLSPVSWLIIDEEKGEIRVDDKPLILPRKEYELIKCLNSRADKVCSRDYIIAQVWPEVVDPGGVADAAIDQLIRRVRVKVEPDISKPTRIINLKGFGYKLVLNDK